MFDADLLNEYRMYHALFDIEDFYGLHPVKTDDGLFLKFTGETIVSDHLDLTGRYFLEDWFDMYQKYKINTDDSDEEKIRKTVEYSLHRAAFGKERAQRTKDKNDKRRKK